MAEGTSGVTDATRIGYVHNFFADKVTSDIRDGDQYLEVNRYSYGLGFLSQYLQTLAGGKRDFDQSPVKLKIDDKEITINKELAEKIIKLTGSKSEIVFKPLPQDDPVQRQPDIAPVRRR